MRKSYEVIFDDFFESMAMVACIYSRACYLSYLLLTALNVVLTAIIIWNYATLLSRELLNPPRLLLMPPHT